MYSNLGSGLVKIQVRIADNFFTARMGNLNKVRAGHTRKTTNFVLLIKIYLTIIRVLHVLILK